MNRLPALAVVALTLLPRAGRAQGTPCASSSGRPRVELSGSGADGAVEALLRAQLASRRIDLCPPSDVPGAAIAAVSVTSHADGASIDVEVRDRLTAKRVSRDVDLSSVPVDGRPLTLALVIDELLRASWAELALGTAPPPSQPVPEAVKDTVQGALSRRSGATGVRLEAMAEVEAWTGLLTLYGADVRFGATSDSGLGGAVRFGGRGGVSASGPDGQVEASAWLAGVGASFRAVPAARPYGLDAVARIDVARIAYVAVANPGARGASQADTTLLVGAGIDGWMAAGTSAQLVGELVVDAPLRAVAAQDAGRSVVAASGVGLEGGVGIRVAF